MKNISVKFLILGSGSNHITVLVTFILGVLAQTETAHGQVYPDLRSQQMLYNQGMQQIYYMRQMVWKQQQHRQQMLWEQQRQQMLWVQQRQQMFWEQQRQRMLWARRRSSGGGGQTAGDKIADAIEGLMKSKGYVKEDKEDK